MKFRRYMAILLVLTMLLTIPAMAAQTETVIATGTVNVSESLNVRAGPGSGYEMVGTLGPGDRVEIYEIQAVGSTDWGRIAMGWISLDYVILDAVMPEPGELVSGGEWGQDEDPVYWAIDSNATLWIYGEGRMEDCFAYNYDNDGPSWYRGWDDYLQVIRTVVIDEGITYVGDSSFRSAGNLESVFVADSVTRIGDWAFAECDGLTNVSLGAGVSKTGIELFSGCDGLVSFTFPNREIDIGNAMFLNCENLKYVTFSENMTTLHESMFKGCSSLTQIHIPDHITTLEAWVFSGCDNLTEVTIPESVTSIGKGVFEYCYALTEVEIPASVTKLPTELFNSCMSLERVILPDTLREMGDAVFAYCHALTSVTVPSGVTAMNNTFESAYGLESVKFLGHAPTFADNLFGGITVTVYYPQNFPSWTEEVQQSYGGTVTWVGYISEDEPSAIRAAGTCGADLTWTLTYDGTLKIEGTGPMDDYYETDTWGAVAPWSDYKEQIYTIEICPGVTATGTYAFYGLMAVNELIVADTVTEIGGYSFYQCAGLPELELPGSIRVIGEHAFHECSSLTEVTIPQGVEEIGESAFFSCSNLTEANLPDSLKILGASAFASCWNLTRVGMNDGLTQIGACAFERTALTEVEIPDSVVSIGASAFAHVPITHITIPENVTTMGHSVFSYSGLTSVTILAELTAIPASTFENTPLTTLTIPDSVTTIEDGAFGWSKLETITIPTGVTMIESSAFMSCESLTAVHFPGNAPAFGARAFRDTTTTIYYPADDPTWTEEVRQQYGGTLTWVAVPAEETPAEFIRGDVNGDGKINGLDVIVLRQHIAGWDVEINLAAANVNADPDDKINSLDMILLRQYVAGWDVEIPGEDDDDDENALPWG